MQGLQAKCKFRAGALQRRSAGRICFSGVLAVLRERAIAAITARTIGYCNTASTSATLERSPCVLLIFANLMTPD